MKTSMREKQWAEKYPDLGTAPLPAEPYISDEFFALERDLVFHRNWIVVGRVDEIPEAGDYFVRDVAICKASILVVRGSDGVVRSFHNVCSHRSNKLVLDKRGSCAGGMYCHFHNWLYSDKGALLRVPDEENFFDFDKRDHGLKPVLTDTCAGFVFIHLHPEPVETLHDYLGGISDRLNDQHFHEMALMQTYGVTESANWKVGLDAQNELYHFPFQHRWISGDSLLMNDKKQCRYRDVTLYNYHSTWSCEYDPVSKPTPLKAALFKMNKKTRTSRLPRMIGDTELFTLFPNFEIVVMRVGGVMTSYLTYQFWPLTVDSTLWEIRIHFRKPQTARELLQQEYYKCITRDTLQEDTASHETVHKGLVSRANSHMILQDNEIAIRHFHKVLKDRVGLHLN